MVIRSRHLAAALLGLCAAHAAPAQQPGRLGLDHPPAVLESHNRVTNQALADAVARHLRASGLLRNYQIELACKAGLVEISGQVSDPDQREQVLRLVREVPGVEDVLNRLTVGEGLILTQADEPARLPDALPGPPKDPAPADEPGEKRQHMQDPMPLYAAPGAAGATAGSPATTPDLNPPRMPPYAWPTYAPYPNFSRVAYPTAYPYNAWPYIGPVYPFPKVPLGWRSVKLEFEDGYWWYSKVASKHNWWRLKYW